VAVITRVAGTGAVGDRGDDGTATEAEPNEPGGVAVTADGGFLIADTGNHVVREVTPEGFITRVAGTGAAGNSGVVATSVSRAGVAVVTHRPCRRSLRGGSLRGRRGGQSPR
jgi:hypothetical protein